MSLKLSRSDFSRFLAASPSERSAWLQAFAAVAVARVGLKVISVERLASGLGISVCRGEAEEQFCTAAPVVTVAARVRGVLRRWPTHSRCLIGALATGFLLRQLNPKLFIGVRKRGPTIAAHAWLDVDGGRVPITLPDDSLDFVRLRRSRLV